LDNVRSEEHEDVWGEWMIWGRGCMIREKASRDQMIRIEMIVEMPRENDGSWPLETVLQNLMVLAQWKLMQGKTACGMEDIYRPFMSG
jgi:hypothetical protein